MMTMNERWIIPEWPAPSNVRSIQTTRHGGVSSGAYASMNVAMHVNDAPQSVAQNRQYLRQILPNEPLWLNQVHGVDVLDATHAKPNMQADAAYTRHKQVVCVSMTADCLPVLFCDQSGTVVAAAHAGWRGLCAGVLEKTVSAMQVQTNSVMAWFGPAIGPAAFEVGGEVRQAFIQQQEAAEAAFKSKGDKWLADIYHLAQLRLNRMGVYQIYGGDYCTYHDSERFFSFRRDPICGRMASMIWLE